MATKRNGELNVAALIDKMELEIVDTASLTPYARNPRINDAAVAAVAASIKSFGFRVPLVIHGADNEIINGHTRWKAANKLGSDMADSVTGGGLHGKDLSKADVSVNIYAFLKAQETNAPVSLSCAIGNETVDGKPYSKIVAIARDYIRKVGGFEMFAEWGLV